MLVHPTKPLFVVSCLLTLAAMSIGYISPAAAQQSSSDAEQNRSQPGGEQLARTALTYRGGSYRRGGSNTASGFDCAGLTQAVCRQMGISIPRTPRDQFTKGTAISKENLVPGDLVFFRNTCRPGISHVGIYLGNGKFVHASTPSTGVIVSALSETYYAKRYAGARRMKGK